MSDVDSSGDWNPEVVNSLEQVGGAAVTASGAINSNSATGLFDAISMIGQAAVQASAQTQQMGIQTGATTAQSAALTSQLKGCMTALEDEVARFKQAYGGFKPS
jgi:hypothetical protein